jgi:hypothetical protein
MPRTITQPNGNTITLQDNEANIGTLENPIITRSGSTQPVQPPTDTTNPQSATIDTSSVPRVRTIYDAADEPQVSPAKSVDEIQQEMLKQAQGEIGSLDDYYATLKKEALVTGDNNLRTTNAISTLSGLGGSTEAAGAANKTRTATQDQLSKIDAEKNAAIQQILSGIRTNAVEEARQQRQEAQQSEQDRLAYREKAQEEAVNNLTALAKTATGTTLDGLRKALSPEEYNTLITNAGGEEMAKAIVFENRAKDTVLGSPQVVGGKMVQAYQTPDGRVKYETVDLPDGVTPDNVMSVEKTDSGIFIIKNDGTYSRIANSGKTYAPTSGTGTSSNNAQYNDEFAATIDQVANMETTVSGKNAVRSQLQSLIANKDYSSAYTQIANTVENGLVGEAKQRYANARTDYQVMSGLRDAIQEYANAGGDMGLLKGSAESISRKLGQVTDPKLSSIAVQLQREFQTYRNTMTGAAFGPAESREYASVNPTTTKNLDLNLSVIDGALAQLENRVAGTINSRVPSAKYILEYAQNPNTSSSDQYADLRSELQPGEILVQDAQGNIGAISESEYNSSEYTKL